MTVNHLKIAYKDDKGHITDAELSEYEKETGVLIQIFETKKKADQYRKASIPAHLLDVEEGRYK